MGRRIAVVAVILAAFGGPATAAPGAQTSFYAEANWFLKTRDPRVLTWYSAIAFGTNDVGADDFAAVVKGSCRVKGNSAGPYLACQGRDVAAVKDQDVFEMDPAMQAAVLEIDHPAGSAQKVEWAAEPNVLYGPDPQACAVGARAEVTLGRQAQATGTIAGRNLSQPAKWRGDDGTVLLRGAAADACARERISLTTRFFTHRA